jgi:thiol:disulfide interchange protein DsbC
MVRGFVTVCAVLAGLAAGSACASEAAIRQSFQARFPNATVESVARTPFAGIYEVVFNGQIAYTDEKLNFVLFGNLVDVREGAERNLTRERSAQLASQALRQSADNAVKRVRGNGKRVLYTFEDPNCGFCRELQKELMKLTDVTIYTFLWPILSADSVDKSRAVWCSRDRAKAWDDLMSGAFEDSPASDGRSARAISMGSRALTARGRDKSSRAIELSSQALSARAIERSSRALTCRAIERSSRAVELSSRAITARAISARAIELSA